MASVLTDPRQKALYMAPVSNPSLLALPQYASVPDPRQNAKNNRAESPYCTGVIGFTLRVVG